MIRRLRAAPASALGALHPAVKDDSIRSLADVVNQLDACGSAATIHVDRATCADLLRQCTTSKSLWHGKRLHAHIIESGKDRDTLLGNLLVQMYSSCGYLEEARAAFKKIASPNVYSWNIMFAAYAQNGDVYLARTMFNRMPEWNIISFNAFISSYSRNGLLEEAREIFNRMPEQDVVSWNAMVRAYCQNGYIEDAQRMFYKMPQWNVVAWTAMIQALAQNGHLDVAMSMFNEMPEKNTLVHNALIAAYAQKGHLERARIIFEDMTIRDVVSFNVMIAAYSQNGHPEEARSYFEMMPERDVVSWNSLISADARNGDLERAKAVFDKMPQQNVISSTAMIYAYAQNGHLEAAEELFEGMQQRNIVSCNAMIAAYAHNGIKEGAERAFGKMPKWNLVSWTAMIAAYVQNGYVENARSIFDGMPVRSTVTWNAMITGYSQNGFLDDAVILFEQLPMKDVISWSAIIAGHAQSGNGKLALRYFRLMEIEGIKPDEITYISILDACAALADLTQGKLLHGEILLSRYESDTMVANSLVNMYGKCGHLDEARTVFDSIPKRAVASWNTLLATYAQNGHARDTLELFQVMEQEGTTPNSITYIVVLSACGHMGFVDIGSHHFISMSENYGITPTREHFMCMVDLLGRAGKLETAEEVVAKMPIEPDVVAWTTLLDACRSHGSVERAERVAEHVFKLDEQGSSSPYVLLSSIHAASRPTRILDLCDL